MPEEQIPLLEVEVVEKKKEEPVPEEKEEAPSGAMQYSLSAREPRSKEELKQLAIDMQAGKVFTDRHIRPNDIPRMMTMVFPILLFMDGEARQGMIDDGVAVVYEYMDKASPRAVNGYPIFFSCGTLTAVEWDTIVDMIERIEEALKNV